MKTKSTREVNVNDTIGLICTGYAQRNGGIRKTIDQQRGRMDYAQAAEIVMFVVAMGVLI